ncbi:tetratricopeptide repeat protein [Pedobacter sp. Du54]|uniref:tetratricopeptide repeat protein n=1 Tax=Pedobacter anseongensis TaxID=3133439 RepID=UPI0030A6CC10
MQNDRLSKLLEFLSNDSSDPFVLYAIATEYNVINDTKNAFHYYLRLIEEYPDYVGTYYHLGKLYEKENEKEKAIATYQTGMLKAKTKRDMHSFSELQGAYASAAGLDYEDE